MIIKNNEELKKLIKNSIIDCEGENLFCDFHIAVDAHIKAWNIKAQDIKAWNINANNINAWNINAENIDAWNIKAQDINAGNIKAWNIKALNIGYYAVCCAYKNITCESITGTRNNSKHFVLDGKIMINGEERK